MQTVSIGRDKGECSRLGVGDLLWMDPSEPVVVEGYLWSLTEAYTARAFYFEVIEYIIQKLARCTSRPSRRPLACLV